MVNARISRPGVHDLVHINSPALTRLVKEAARGGEDWVAESLHLAPWAVVRRARPGGGQQVAIGVRGPQRSQRWAAEVGVSEITETIEVTGARGFPIRRPQLPAFQALKALSDAPLPLPWGPGGSLGFELVTGVAAAREGSDVDLIVYAGAPLTDQTITELEQISLGAQKISGVQIDLLVETPYGGIAFAELARAVGMEPKPTMMLRTADGPELVKDPWS